MSSTSEYPGSTGNYLPGLPDISPCKQSHQQAHLEIYFLTNVTISMDDFFLKYHFHILIKFDLIVPVSLKKYFYAI